MSPKYQIMNIRVQKLEFQQKGYELSKLIAWNNLYIPYPIPVRGPYYELELEPEPTNSQYYYSEHSQILIKTYPEPS